MDELKPCPFCGNANKETLAVKEPYADVFFDAGDHYYRAWCRECNSFGPPSKERNRAIQHWNREG